MGAVAFHYILTNFGVITNFIEFISITVRYFKFDHKIMKLGPFYRLQKLYVITMSP